MRMRSSNVLVVALLLLLLFPVLFSVVASAPMPPPHENESFLQCLSLSAAGAGGGAISKVVYTQSDNSSSYASIWQSRAQNLKLLRDPNTPKPQLIITPSHESHIQAAVVCSTTHGLQLRVRSGGHDFEGLSYVATVPFVLLDLINLRAITVDPDTRTAWAQAGASNGELYHAIAQKSATLGFPAGICPTVGLGGHISGGGYGYMVRKYGLAADHAIDARLVDVKGRILDRKGMGEDLFWAIRGGGGGSFGIVLSWKFGLVPVPSTVTVFRVSRTLEQGALHLVHRWQYVAPKLQDEITIRVSMVTAANPSNSTTTIRAAFASLFLGGADALLSLIKDRFPQLGLAREDCMEMPWVNATVFLAGGYPRGTPVDVLLDRSSPLPKAFFKTKSDYVTQPISEIALEAILKQFHEMEVGEMELRFTPFGGEMDRIPDTATPYPNRAGTLYQVQYLLIWTEDGDAAFQRHLNWLRRLYDYMARYVSKSPRLAYINYKDLDLGTTRTTTTKGYGSYKEASVWGYKYFKNNFNRLVQVKTKVDPQNFFSIEHGIPSMLA